MLVNACISACVSILALEPAVGTGAELQDSWFELPMLYWTIIMLCGSTWMIFLRGWTAKQRHSGLHPSSSCS